MPFIATHNGATVSPHEVDAGAALECVECKNSMHVVDSHTRNGTVVVRHFRHPSIGGGEGSGGGCGGGESDLHKRVKGIALDHVNNRYEDIADRGIEEAIGNRTADAYIEFSSPKLPLETDSQSRCSTGTKTKISRPSNGITSSTATASSGSMLRMITIPNGTTGSISPNQSQSGRIPCHAIQALVTSDTVIGYSTSATAEKTL